MRILFTLLFFSTLAQAQTWLQLPDFPAMERDDGVAVTVGNKSYFGTGSTASAGNSNQFFSLDGSTSAWTAIAPMPQYTERQYACAFAGANSFYVFSGDGIGGPLNDLYSYNIANNAWTLKTPRPGPGVYGAACLEFGDKVIIVGGKSFSNVVVGDVWEYTQSTDSWLQKNNFPGGRFRASAAVINGAGYLMFGEDGNDHLCKDMYRYDHSSDTWTKILDFPQPLGRYYAALRPVSQKLLLFGGYDSLNVYHKDVWYFDPAIAQWTQQTDFPSFGRKGGMSAVIGTKFYYSCGIDVNNMRLKETWVLDVPVGIKENAEPELFSLYPNPVQDAVYIQAAGKTRITELTVTDVSGREIKQLYCEALDNTHLRAGIGDLNPGIYFLKIGTEDHRTECKKIVKE